METCAQCGVDLRDDAVAVEDRRFCPRCYAALAALVDKHALGRGVSWPLSIVGAVVGGLVGAAIWTASVVFTGWQIGLVAIAISWLTAWGMLKANGGHRSIQLQGLSVAVSLVAYGLAHTVISVMSGVDPVGGFEAFDLIFVGIVVYEAWRIPAPVRFVQQ